MELFVLSHLLFCDFMPTYVNVLKCRNYNERTNVIQKLSIRAVYKLLAPWDIACSNFWYYPCRKSNTFFV